MKHSESMDESKSIAASEPGAEHPANGVETGFDLGEAAKLLRQAAEEWQDRDKPPALMLRAIARLTEAHPSQAEIGFSMTEVAEEIAAQTGKPFGRLEDPTETREKVRKLWKQLEVKWESKSEGVRQLFGDHGWTFAPQPKRIPGGGSGNLTRYRLVANPLEPVNAVSDSVSHTVKAQQGSLTPALQYTCEDLDDAGALARFFSNGLGLAGFTGLAFRALLVASIVTTGALVYLLLITVLLGSGTVLPSLLAAGLIASGYVTTLKPLVELPLTRVALAPWWLQTPEDDRLIEWRGPPRYEGRTIKASRYTAPCPVCGGRVVARSGGWKRGFALVGRCREAPDAHVFSFDHVTRQGNPLG